MGKPRLFHLELAGVPIFEQLQIEEALLRCSTQNILVTNNQVPPAIVMGISGKFSSLINKTVYETHPIPLIKRYSGGGTVVVDPSTCFVSFLCNHKDTCLGRTDLIHDYMHSFYQTLFLDPSFSLRENDYVLGEKKFGGNAQYVTKERWVHHTTFLWDFSPQLMEYLTLPEKRPKYRENRPHDQFLTTMQKVFPHPDIFFTTLLDKAEKLFQIEKMPLTAVEELLDKGEYRKSTKKIDL